MDRLIYVSMTGAKQALLKQAVTSANLANVNTQGYKAQTNDFRALWVYGDGMPTRTFAVAATTGTDFRPGPVIQTGRPLDVAIPGQGWLAVQGADGKEAYTRSGSLQLDAAGTLTTGTGHPVMGDGGAIQLPAGSEISIGRDGTISVVPNGNLRNQVTVVGRLKLVNPDEKTLERGEDGLFRTQNGQAAEADAGVQVASGGLEGSNVSVADALINLINQSRQFEMQVKMLQNADQNARQTAQLLNLNG